MTFLFEYILFGSLPTIFFDIIFDLPLDSLPFTSVIYNVYNFLPRYFLLMYSLGLLLLHWSTLVLHCIYSHSVIIPRPHKIAHQHTTHPCSHTRHVKPETSRPVGNIRGKIVVTVLCRTVYISIDCEIYL